LYPSDSRDGMPVLYKNAEVKEMDTEMADYFPTTEGNNDAMATNGTEGAQTTVDGDTAMDDEVL
jgi:hypothetical protein